MTLTPRTREDCGSPAPTLRGLPSIVLVVLVEVKKLRNRRCAAMFVIFMPIITAAFVQFKNNQAIT